MVLHELVQHRVQYFRSSLLQPGLPQSLKSFQESRSSAGPVSTGPQVLLAETSHGITAFLGQPPAPVGVLHRLHPYGSPWAAGAQGLHHGLYQRLQGNPSSGSWSTSCPSFSTDPGILKEGQDLLQNEGGNQVTQDMVKAEVLNAFFASVLTGKFSLQESREENWSQEDVLETGPAQGTPKPIGYI